jgi:hypothetical protein
MCDAMHVSWETPGVSHHAQAVLSPHHHALAVLFLCHHAPGAQSPDHYALAVVSLSGRALVHGSSMAMTGLIILMPVILPVVAIKPS